MTKKKHCVQDVWIKELVQMVAITFGVLVIYD